MKYIQTERTKGYFWWKKILVSVCSIHQEYDSNCSICNKSIWVNYNQYKKANKNLIMIKYENNIQGKLK